MILFGWRGGLVVSHVSVLYMWVPCLLRTKYWNGTRFSSTSLRFLFSKFSWLWELLFQGKSLPSDWLICLLSMSIPWQLRFLCLYYYLSRLFFLLFVAPYQPWEYLLSIHSSHFLNQRSLLCDTEKILGESGKIILEKRIHQQLHKYYQTLI